MSAKSDLWNTRLATALSITFVLYSESPVSPVLSINKIVDSGYVLIGVYLIHKLKKQIIFEII